jgi:uncharacterized membrane protein
VPTPRPRSALIIGDRNPALPAAVSPPLASAAAFASTARLSRRWSKKMGLALLVLGLILFLGPHVFVTMRAQRDTAVKRIGEWPYKGLFAVVTVVGLFVLAKGFALYRDAGPIEVWDPPNWTRHITVALMWPAVILVTAAYIPGDIKRILKHPMLAGVKLWAVAHLISNGDLGSIILFVSILAWAVYDRISLKRRTDTGSLPIPMGGLRNDIVAIVVGTILYAVLGTVFHRYVIGLPVFGAAP